MWRYPQPNPLRDRIVSISSVRCGRCKPLACDVDCLDRHLILPLDLSAQTNLASNPASLVDSLNTLLMSGQMSYGMRNIVINAVSQIPAANTLERAQTAVAHGQHDEVDGDTCVRPGRHGSSLIVTLTINNQGCYRHSDEK